MATDEPTAQRAGAKIIERGPYGLTQLASIFEAMPPSELTLRWVKMFAEAMGEHAEDIERCLKPVADRLRNRPAKALRRTPPKKVADEAAPQPVAMAMPAAAPAPAPVEVEDDSRHDAQHDHTDREQHEAA